MVSSAHTKTKKTKSVNLCSAQLISAQLRRAHGQKTNKKYGPRSRDGSKSFFASPSQVTSHFLASPSQVTSHFLASPSQVTSHLVRRQVKSQVIWSDVKSSHKSFGPNTSQVTSLFVQVQVKSHIILSSCNTQSGPVIKSIYSELQSKIYEMVNGIK